MAFVTIPTKSGPLELVVITAYEYGELLSSDAYLQCLHDAGVDNWSGYHLASQMFYGNEEDEDE